jgi:chromosome segregation ATPase
MPWIKISHEIPNIDYNEAAIINKNADINQLNNEKAKFDSELNGLLAQKERLEQSLEQLNEIIVDLADEKEKVESEIYLTHLKRWYQEINTEKTYLISSSDIEEEEIDRIEQDITQLEESLTRTKKTKKYLAIIIKTQLETARLIREFTEIIIRGGSRENMETTDETLKSCLEFIEEYDTNINIIKDLVEQE